jgi:hypothetical protein
MEALTSAMPFPDVSSLGELLSLSVVSIPPTHPVAADVNPLQLPVEHMDANSGGKNDPTWFLREHV